MAVEYRIKEIFFIVNLLICSGVECQITSSLSDLEVCTGSDVKLNWVYGDAAGYGSVTWEYTNSTSTPTTIMQITVADTTATVFGGFNVVHDGNGAVTLTEVTLSNSGSYKISVTYLSGTTADDDTVNVTVKECPDSFPTWVIVVIILVVLYLIGVVLGIFMFCPCSDSDCNIIYIGVNKFCWESAQCLVLGVGFSCLIVVGLGILTVYVICKCCIQENAKPDDDQDKKPGNTVQPKPKSRDPEKGSTNKNDNTPKKVEKKPGRAQPPLPAVAASEAMHGREPDKRKKKHKRRLEESDSGVSRTDVELQDSSKLNKRPMPGIPQGHDSKGRGLSANFDDDHPMIGIDLPAKKAGALQPLHEGTGDQEPKKLKKKKKKKSEDYNDE